VAETASGLHILPQTLILYRIKPPLSMVFFGWGRSFSPAWFKTRPNRVADLIQVVSPGRHFIWVSSR
jgi:hypothetical protein